MNNLSAPSKNIAKNTELGELIINSDIWDIILKQSHDDSN